MPGMFWTIFRIIGFYTIILPSIEYFCLKCSKNVSFKFLVQNNVVLIFNSVKIENFVVSPNYHPKIIQR